MPPLPAARRRPPLVLALLFLGAASSASAGACSGLPGVLIISCVRLQAAVDQYQRAAEADKADALAGLRADEERFRRDAQDYQKTHAGDVPPQGSNTDLSGAGVVTVGMNPQVIADNVTRITGDVEQRVPELLASDAAPSKDAPTVPVVRGSGNAPSRPYVPKAPAQTAAAGQALANGDAVGAVKTLDGVLSKNKDDPAALVLRAQARMALGDSAGALADAERASALDPKDKEAAGLVAELRGLVRAQGKVKGAKLDFGAEREAGAAGGGVDRGAGGGRALRGGAAGGTPGAPGAAVAAGGGFAPPAAGNLLRHAWDLWSIGDFTGAVLPLREALDLDPKNRAAWDLLAEISNKTGNAAGAIEAAERALALNPDDARALRAKAYAELSRGDYAAALADAERAVSLEPEVGLGYLYRAMAEEHLGDKAKALADYARAERLDPSLATLVDPAVRRLGGGAPARTPGSWTSGPRVLWRAGALALSTLLVVLGLMGTATGRRAATTLKGWVTPRPGSEGQADTIELGTVVGGHYRVTRELGRGGMGVVYEAVDETLQRRVALKRLQRDLREDAVERERFVREARLAAQLEHPNLARIHAVVSEGDLLLVFEHVDGETLDRVLARGPVAPGAARRLLAQACAALDYAHARRIVHRDLKPANAMLTREGVLKIMDFGIAHQARGADLTRTVVSGTPPYMPPEQLMGSVSAASDFYALGVMAYEMLTGVRPFQGPDFLTPKLQRDFVPASRRAPALPPGVDAFFARALEPDPTKRPASGDEFLGAFDAALSVTPGRA